MKMTPPMTTTMGNKWTMILTQRTAFTLTIRNGPHMEAHTHPPDPDSSNITSTQQTHTQAQSPTATTQPATQETEHRDVYCPIREMWLNTPLTPTQSPQMYTRPLVTTNQTMCICLWQCHSFKIHKMMIHSISLQPLKTSLTQDDHRSHYRRYPKCL